MSYSIPYLKRRRGEGVRERERERERGGGGGGGKGGGGEITTKAQGGVIFAYNFFFCPALGGATFH